MAKTSPEKLAAALRANLKKRKTGPRPAPGSGQKAVEKPAPVAHKPPQG
jgi:hypothetical protein